MFAFVLMPFDEKFDDVYRLGIKETAEKLGIRAERVDEQIFHKENILERIYGQIESADFIIADMSGRNPNVFYETGYAHAKGKTCLLLTSNVDDIPFDLKHHRHIVYGESIQNLRRQLEKDLDWIKAEVKNRQATISVKLNRIDGLLEKNEWSARAKVDIYFDLHNATTDPSSEIESIYFFTSRGWEFSQDGQECPVRDVEFDGYAKSHFVKTPIRRLQANSWAQVKLVGEKLLAHKSKDRAFKDKYRVAGRSLVRIATPQGNFDYPIDLDVTVDEFPF